MQPMSQYPLVVVDGTVVLPHSQLRMRVDANYASVLLKPSGHASFNDSDPFPIVAVFPVIDDQFYEQDPETATELNVVQRANGRNISKIGCFAEVIHFMKVRKEGAQTDSFQYSVMIKGTDRCRFISEMQYTKGFSYCVAEPFKISHLRTASDVDTKKAVIVRQAAKLLFSMFPTHRSLATEPILGNQEIPISKLADLVAGSFDDSFLHQKIRVLQSSTEEELMTKAMQMINDKYRSQGSDRSVRIAPNNFLSLVKDMQSRRLTNDRNRRVNREDEAEDNGFASTQGSNEEDDLLELKKDLDKRREDFPPGVLKVVERELRRISKMQSSSPEYTVSRTYLETLADYPWGVLNVTDTSMIVAKQRLDEDHFGLDQVKKRIFQYIAVSLLAEQHAKQQEIVNGGVEAKHGKARSPTIVCLMGPPGVGKTSLGKSIASALGRKFERVSLGGVHDEAEIRGHRRTYIGSMPGSIVQAVRRAGCVNPVLLLDEIDKLGQSGGRRAGGDPYAAMLEVLDPDQNHSFMDHYMGVPIDLSQVVFIATANYIEGIAGPLLDRMEVIPLAGYTVEEKLMIAKKYLVPRQISAAYLSGNDITFLKSALHEIITGHTREAGVRELERSIGSVCRHIAVEVANKMSQANETSSEPNVESRSLVEAAPLKVVVDSEYVSTVMGSAKFKQESALASALPGVSTGMAWTPTGGDLLFIETCCFADIAGAAEVDHMKHTENALKRSIGRVGRVVITGNMGKVMQESCTIALSWIRNNIASLEESYGLEVSLASHKIIDPQLRPLRARVFNTDVHIHVPAGAISKDGPSAGCAILCSLLSMFTGRVVDPTLAMTGEVTLRGKVLPVGGIKEKLLAAIRGGISKIILPSGNKRDLEEIKGMHALEITLVDNVEEVISLALIDQDQVPADQSYRLTNNSSSIEMTGINSYELLVGPLLRSSL